jgi:hypothetical protein
MVIYATGRTVCALPILWCGLTAPCPCRRYVLTRPLVKLRLPVELGVAAVLARLCPPLTQIKVSALLGLLPPSAMLRGEGAAWVRRVRPRARPPRCPPAVSGRGTLCHHPHHCHDRRPRWLQRARPSHAPARPRRGLRTPRHGGWRGGAVTPWYRRPPALQRGADALALGGRLGLRRPEGGGTVLSAVLSQLARHADHYGAALYIARDMVGVSSILLLTVALRCQLDLVGTLERWFPGQPPPPTTTADDDDGNDDSGSGGQSERERKGTVARVAETAAGFAGGALVASCLSPLYLLTIGRGVPAIVHAVRGGARRRPVY